MKVLPHWGRLRRDHKTTKQQHRLVCGVTRHTMRRVGEGGRMYWGGKSEGLELRLDITRRPDGLKCQSLDEEAERLRRDGGQIWV